MTLASAGSWSQEQKPIDCSTARDDIETLVHEHKAIDERIAADLIRRRSTGIHISH